jgi:uncharacterized protein YuzE
MKFKYYPETDTLYVELKEIPSVESEEVADGVVVDYDESGEIVGIEIENVSRRDNLDLPFVVKILPASA